MNRPLAAESVNLTPKLALLMSLTVHVVPQVSPAPPREANAVPLHDAATGAQVALAVPAGDPAFNNCAVSSAETWVSESHNF